jgi:adenylate kinase family enzyme
VPLQRIVVAGSSGAGKTTTCNRLAERLGLARVEIDGLFHGPGWEPRESFAADVDAFTQGPAWVIEWQYRSVRPLLAARADTLVWLDFRRTTVMTRLIRRTVIRRLRRVELWNGNLEPPLWTFFTDRDHIVRWGWRTHADKPAQVREVVAANPHLQVIVLRSQREVDRWLASL